MRVGAQRGHEREHFQNHERRDGAVDQRREHRDGLHAELLPVAGDDSVSAARIPIRSREHAGEQRADDAADTVRRDDVERVVEARLRAIQQREVARECGERADDECGARSDESCGRRDGDEPDDDAGRGADCGRFLRSDEIEQRPDDERRHRREQRVQERQRCDRVRRERASGVESEPAEPQQSRAEQRERNVLRQDRLPRVVLARPDHDRTDERRRRRIHVHDRAAREVERAELPNPSAAPHPMRDRRVHD